MNRDAQAALNFSTESLNDNPTYMLPPSTEEYAVSLAASVSQQIRSADVQDDRLHSSEAGKPLIHAEIKLLDDRHNGRIDVMKVGRAAHAQEA